MIAVRHLAFTYRADAPFTLSDITHEFEAGSLTAVTGPSGCGKSTLLYLLALMLRPTWGQICWGGEVVSSRSDSVRSRIRAHDIGFVFQDALLDPSRTILDNVMEGGLYCGMAASVSRQRAMHLLERFGVVHRVDHRPGEISGGQAQRVALCRALLKSPRLLLADEPSGNLDPASAQVVWDGLRLHAKAGSTVVVATHDEARAASADRTLTLALGSG